MRLKRRNKRCEKKKTYGRQGMVRCPSERETLAPVFSWSQSALKEPSVALLQNENNKKRCGNVSRYVGKRIRSEASSQLIITLELTKEEFGLSNVCYLSPCSPRPSWVPQERKHFCSDHLKTEKICMDPKEFTQLNTW